MTIQAVFVEVTTIDLPKPQHEYTVNDIRHGIDFHLHLYRITMSILIGIECIAISVTLAFCCGMRSIALCHAAILKPFDIIEANCALLTLIPINSINSISLIINPSIYLVHTGFIRMSAVHRNINYE